MEHDRANLAAETSPLDFDIESTCGSWRKVGKERRWRCPEQRRRQACAHA